MITQKEARRLQFEKSTLTDADLSSGPDEDTSIPADTVAEVANVRIGGDNAGNVSDVLALVVGVPSDEYKSTTRAKQTVDLQDGSSSDVDSNTQFRWAKRRRQSRGGREITGWQLEDNFSEIAISEREDLNPSQPGVREDELLTLLVYNATSAVTVNLANSNVRLPIQSGR